MSGIFSKNIKKIFARIAPDLFKQRLLNPIYVSKRKKYYLLKRRAIKVARWSKVAWTFRKSLRFKASVPEKIKKRFQWICAVLFSSFWLTGKEKEGNFAGVED